MFIYDNISFLVYNFVCCSILFFSYNPIHIVFEKFITPYKNIYPTHKKIYFVSNLLKSIVLGIFSYKAFLILFQYAYYNNWVVEDIKYLGAVYASLDMVSMFKVPKMQFNTIVHHTIVQFLYIISLIFLDFDKNSLANGVVIYAIFSTFAFLVNMYLALRLIIEDKNNLKLLASISSLIYQVCCTINWSYQIYFIYSFSNISLIIRILYSIILMYIVFDDIVLIKFLNKNSFLN